MPSLRRERTTTSLLAILFVTFLASIGTGILWSGVSFIAKHDYGYSQEWTFVLFIATAVTYIIAALSSGRLTRAVARLTSPRGVLVALLLLQAVVAIGPVVVRAGWMLWLAACATSVLAALLWPIIESYLTAGRHGRVMRSAMGWWNVVWTTAVAVAMLGMAPLLSPEHPGRGVWALAALAPCSLLCLPALMWFSRRPGHHDESMHAASVTAEYPLLLRSVRVLLPLSYLLIGAISPLMPFRLEDLEVRTIYETPVTATWMIVRVIVIALMWRLQFWHGRWGALLLGGVAMTIGFTLIVIAPTVLALLLGLVLLGTGQGVVYYAALYYAMTVGRAEVDAGGIHEALIGVGYAVGPLACLGGRLGPSALGLSISTDNATVAVVAGMMVFAVLPAIQPYVRALRHRSPHKPD